jgi:hypothetical protein
MYGIWPHRTAFSYGVTADVNRRLGAKRKSSDHAAAPWFFVFLTLVMLQHELIPKWAGLSSVRPSAYQTLRARKSLFDHDIGNA